MADDLPSDDDGSFPLQDPIAHDEELSLPSDCDIGEIIPVKHGAASSASTQAQPSAKKKGKAVKMVKAKTKARKPSEKKTKEPRTDMKQFIQNHEGEP